MTAVERRTWDDDVADALLTTENGGGNGETSRVLAAEVKRLRALAGEPPVVPLRCPACGLPADRAEKALGGPAVYRHGEISHLAH